MPDIDERLLKAAANRGPEVILQLVSEGADVNAKDWEGDTPLHIASRNGNYRVVQTLVDCGANIDEGNASTGTPLHIAARTGNPKTVEALLSAGAGKDTTGMGNDTPLHEAARNGELECCTLLIEAGHNINSVNKHGETPIYLAADRGRCNSAMALLDAGADIRIKYPRNQTLLHKAAYHGSNLELVKELISRGLEIDPKDDSDWTPLHYAILRGEPKIVSVLLAAGADPNCKGVTWQGTPILVSCGDNVVKTIIGLAGGSSKPKSQYQKQFLARLKDDPSLARNIDLANIDPSRELLAKALVITGGNVMNYMKNI